VFTGQGAQYSKMGLELIQYPVFMSGLQEADKVFRAMGADWSLFGTNFLHSAFSMISGHS
jgi:acyl transferase domain-containing protein